jgi:integrase
MGQWVLISEKAYKAIGERDARLQVRGKVKHGTAVPLFGTVAALDMLWDLFVFEVGREPIDDDPVFAGSDGKAIKSFKRSFTELLKAAGLEKDYRGVARTTYSLRHYYISAMIAQNVSVHHIARNTRTSLEMIDKHYAQVSTEEIKDYLRPGQADFGKKLEQFPEGVQEEIDLLERRISELKAGRDRGSTLAKLGKIYKGDKPTP